MDGGEGGVHKYLKSPALCDTHTHTHIQINEGHKAKVTIL